MAAAGSLTPTLSRLRAEALQRAGPEGEGEFMGVG